MNFSLSAPRRETFLVSAIIAILVVIGMIVPLPFFTSYALGLLDRKSTRLNSSHH